MRAIEVCAAPWHLRISHRLHGPYLGVHLLDRAGSVAWGVRHSTVLLH